MHCVQDTAELADELKSMMYLYRLKPPASQPDAPAPVDSKAKGWAGRCLRAVGRLVPFVGRSAKPTTVPSLPPKRGACESHDIDQIVALSMDLERSIAAAHQLYKQCPPERVLQRKQWRSNAGPGTERLHRALESACAQQQAVTVSGARPQGATQGRVRSLWTAAKACAKHVTKATQEAADATKACASSAVNAARACAGAAANAARACVKNALEAAKGPPAQPSLPSVAHLMHRRRALAAARQVKRRSLPIGGRRGAVKQTATSQPTCPSCNHCTTASEVKPHPRVDDAPHPQSAASEVHLPYPRVASRVKRTFIR